MRCLTHYSLVRAEQLTIWWRNLGFNDAEITEHSALDALLQARRIDFAEYTCGVRHAADHGSQVSGDYFWIINVMKPKRRRYRICDSLFE